jgi:multiple sugar transport system permease protein
MTTAATDQHRAAGSYFIRQIGDALERPGVLGALMLGPAVLYVVAFVAVPFFLAIALSMSDATVGDPSIDSFVGLSNFVAVTRQEGFQAGLRNSLIITFITVAGIVVLATIAVEILAREFRGKRLVHVLFMMPWAMPVALAAITWLWLLDSQFSPIDWVLVKLGLLGPGTPLGPAKHLYYLGRQWLGLASVAFVDIWRTLPLATIIVLAGAFLAGL